MKIDYFDYTVEKLKREVDLLMKCAEQIMALPSTKNTHTNQFKQTAQGKFHLLPLINLRINAGLEDAG